VSFFFVTPAAEPAERDDGQPTERPLQESASAGIDGCPTVMWIVGLVCHVHPPDVD
jgi:hypothetical protein